MYLHKDATKADKFQTVVVDEDYGHDWGPNLHVF
jgi:hypothetical protein